ncbi:phage head closure protein [Kaistia terrae]|uniref:Phage head closure protein n=1 Tax=Kaistia terrae TaxID=537017 RepID=A0ABW0PWJ6_9HYPH|nr:phage head closure protein [Kaistia terrae]MCX5576865.1 phage head closure protein [Kaistia terrae]
MNGFDPGQLSSRVTLERQIRVPDGVGGATTDWEEVATVWAAIEPVAAGETFSSDRLATRITHQITLRFRADVEGGMRVRHRERILRIASWRDPDETRRFLILDAVEERS